MPAQYLTAVKDVIFFWPITKEDRIYNLLTGKGGSVLRCSQINLLRRERRGAFAMFTSCRNKKSTDFLGLVCIPKRDRLLLWHLRWKGKTNRSLRGLRMEEQGERSPQTFLVNNFSFLQPRRKQAPFAYYKCEFWYTDRGLTQLPGLKKTKMVMYSISANLNSPFSTIGKATADKITAENV